MSSILLNSYGWWTVEFLNSVIDGLNEVRAESAVLNILLWPVVYGVTVLRVIARCLSRSLWAFPHQVVPDTWRNTWQHFMSKTPLSVYCFNKRGFAALIAEVLIYCYVACIFMVRPFFLIPYILLKVMLSSVSFFDLSPVQRLPVWVVAILFTGVETWAGVKLLRCWFYGIDFYHGHFYNHWAKWYRYRHITSNRVLAAECTRYGYIGVKLAVLNDLICSDKETVAARLDAPYAPTRGEVLTAQELENWIDGLSRVFVDFLGFNLWAALLLLFISLALHVLPMHFSKTSANKGRALVNVTSVCRLVPSSCAFPLFNITSSDIQFWACFNTEIGIALGIVGLILARRRAVHYSLDLDLDFECRRAACCALLVGLCANLYLWFLCRTSDSFLPHFFTENYVLERVMACVTGLSFLITPRTHEFSIRVLFFVLCWLVFVTSVASGDGRFVTALGLYAQFLYEAFFRADKYSWPTSFRWIFLARTSCALFLGSCLGLLCNPRLNYKYNKITSLRWRFSSLVPYWLVSRFCRQILYDTYFKTSERSRHTFSLLILLPLISSVLTLYLYLWLLYDACLGPDQQP